MNPRSLPFLLLLTLPVLLAAQPTPEDPTNWTPPGRQDVFLTFGEMEAILQIAGSPQQQRTRLYFSPALQLVVRFSSETMLKEGFQGHIRPATGNQLKMDSALLAGINNWGAFFQGGYEILAGRINAKDMEESFLSSPTHAAAYRGSSNPTYPYVHFAMGAAYSPPLSAAHTGGYRYTGAITLSGGPANWNSGFAPDGQEIRPDWNMITVVRNGPQANLSLVLPLEDGWHQSSWLGAFRVLGSAGWLYHPRLGFLFSPEENVGRLMRGEGYWFWHPVFGWLWTHPREFPWLWQHPTGHWLRVPPHGPAYNWSTGESFDWPKG
jgi:hypothetical protein